MTLSNVTCCFSAAYAKKKNPDLFLGRTLFWVLDEASPYVVVEGRHAKSGRAAMLPLRQDLADDLRKHVATKGGRDAPLFHVGRNFLRTFNLDLAAAGIPKRDVQGRTVDVHSLRHTFATLLARGGVSPTVAQKLMRHSDIRQTMNTCTHLELADTAGAGLGGVRASAGVEFA